MAAACTMSGDKGRGRQAQHLLGVGAAACALGHNARPPSAARCYEAPHAALAHHRFVPPAAGARTRTRTQRRGAPHLLGLLERAGPGATAAWAGFTGARGAAVSPKPLSAAGAAGAGGWLGAVSPKPVPAAAGAAGGGSALGAGGALPSAGGGVGPGGFAGLRGTVRQGGNKESCCSSANGAHGGGSGLRICTVRWRCLCVPSRPCVLTSHCRPPSTHALDSALRPNPWLAGGAGAGAGAGGALLSLQGRGCGRCIGQSIPHAHDNARPAVAQGRTQQLTWVRQGLVEVAWWHSGQSPRCSSPCAAAATHGGLRRRPAGVPAAASAAAPPPQLSSRLRLHVLALVLCIQAKGRRGPGGGCH